MFYCSITVFIYMYNKVSVNCVEMFGGDLPHTMKGKYMHEIKLRIPKWHQNVVCLRKTNTNSFILIRASIKISY